jgi:hypothetical protein
MSCINTITFLEKFPQFNDLNKYPEESIQFWFDYSMKFFDIQRWGKFYEDGLYLLTAHNLILAGMNGHISGILTSKSVDSVSAGYDVNSIMYKNAGLYNRSVYGMQYYHLSQIIGAGPIGVC